MPALARGQENQPDKVNWFTTINGVLTDMYEVGFRILDITGGLPGTQIFPSTPGDYENVTNAPGRFSVGSYYAYDNANARGWTPDIAEPLGTHRIEWQWKATAAAPYQAGQEDFEVIAQSAGSTGDTYITVQDVRDEGFTIAMADDAKVLSYIETWQAFLERACRQWFKPKIMIIKFDGTDSDALHLGVPIISIDYLKLNNSTDELNASYYRVYNGVSYPDDRRNPRIKLVRSEEFRDIYTAPLTWGDLRFRKGRQNQEVKGTFGFVEEDGSTPKLIQRALLKLVIEKLSTPIFKDPSAGPSPIPPLPPLLGNLLEEETDDHRRKWGQVGGETTPRRAGSSG